MAQWANPAARVTMTRGTQYDQDIGWSTFDLLNSSGAGDVVPNTDVPPVHNTLSADILYSFKFPAGGAKVGACSLLVSFTEATAQSFVKRYYSTVEDALQTTDWVEIGDSGLLAAGSYLVQCSNPGVLDAKWIGYRFVTDFVTDFGWCHALHQEVEFNNRADVEICNPDGSQINTTYAFNTATRGKMDPAGETVALRVRNETGGPVTVNIRRTMHHAEREDLSGKSLNSGSLNQVLKSRLLLSTVSAAAGFVAADVTNLIVPVGGLDFWFRWQPVNTDRGTLRRIGTGALYLEVL